MRQRTTGRYPRAPGSRPAASPIRTRGQRTSARPARPTHRQQPHPPGADQRERIQVLLSPQQPPMQTRADRAAWVPTLEPAEHRAQRHRVAGMDGRPDGLVRRLQPVGVQHGHHPAAGQYAGEPDPPGAGGPDQLTRHTGEIDAPMPGPVRRIGRIEPTGDAGITIKRPPPRRTRQSRRGSAQRHQQQGQEPRDEGASHGPKDCRRGECGGHMDGICGQRCELWMTE